MITRNGIREIGLATVTVGAGAVGCALAAVWHSPFWWPAAALLSAGYAFVLAFFRDPHRNIPDAPGLMVSPADGKVTEVSRLESWPGIEGRATKISIFLSVFNVHINRAPCDGRITNLQYERGEFLDVRHPESGMRNERNAITMHADSVGGPIVVRQIAGLVARRIVCNVGVGETVRRGQRIGMIKFGSRTDLIVPAASGLEPAVKVGDVVKGGATILMRPGATTDAGASQRRAAAAGAA